MKADPITVPIVKDPTKVKSRFIGSFSKRQIVCYGIAILMGVPFYFCTKDVLGKETSALIMVALMFPAIISSIYEKEGLPAEKYFIRYFRWKFIRPVNRAYKAENRFARQEKRKQMEMEVEALERKQTEFRRAKENRNRSGGTKKTTGRSKQKKQT
jgi:hypothetical protein